MKLYYEWMIVHYVGFNYWMEPKDDDDINIQWARTQWCRNFKDISSNDKYLKVGIVPRDDYIDNLSETILFEFEAPVLQNSVSLEVMKKAWKDRYLDEKAEMDFKQWAKKLKTGKIIEEPITMSHRPRWYFSDKVRTNISTINGGNLPTNTDVHTFHYLYDNRQVKGKYVHEARNSSSDYDIFKLAKYYSDLGIIIEALNEKMQKTPFTGMLTPMFPTVTHVDGERQLNI